MTPIPFEVDRGFTLRGESAGEGPAVMLVHGLGFSRRKWGPQVKALTAEFAAAEHGNKLLADRLASLEARPLRFAEEARAITREQAQVGNASCCRAQV